MSGYRPPYTVEEQRKIVQYIIEKKLFYSLRGNEAWKQMEAAGIVNRTWQSAKEHFRKQIMFMLKDPRLKLTDEQIKLITDGYNCTAIPKRPVQSSVADPIDLTEFLRSSSDEET